MKRLVLGAFALATLGACGGTSSKGLGGTAVHDYNLSYDRVVIQRQESGGNPLAMIINYVRGSGAALKDDELPVKVVVQWPIEEGVERDLLVAPRGAVTHITTDGATFPDLQRGNILFDALGNIGENASGHFAATFVGTGGTLNGDFSGTVEKP